MKKIITFICNGNIHRSAIAEIYLNKVLKKNKLDNEFIAKSYALQGTQGTPKPLHKNLMEYPKEYKIALPILKSFKIDITGHLYKKITPSAVEKSAVIIAMDKKTYSQAKNALIKQFPKYKNKIHVFSEFTENHKGIKDPFGNTSPKFHLATIKSICLTIEDQYKNILDLAGL